MSQEERGAESGGEGAKKHVVFCVDGRRYGQPGYAFFTHEADVMMVAAASEVESGKLAPAEARELLEPYREVLPPLYTDFQKAIFDPKRRDWDDPDGFPKAEAVLASPQASQIFWYEVDELSIDGVTLVWSTPFPVLAPVSRKALEELRSAVSDEYEIVAKKDIEEYDAMGKSVEWARELIKEAATTKDSQQSRSSSDIIRPSGSERVRRILADPAFDAGRYIDDDIKHLQAGDLVRICIVNDESQANLIDAVGVVVFTSGDSCTLDVDGETHVFERRDIELMPTGFNSHYEEQNEDREQAIVEVAYGYVGEGLVFIHRGHAKELAKLWDALNKAGTWGEFRRMVGEGRYEEVLDLYQGYDEEDEGFEPLPDEAFDSSRILGLDDGDWPDWPAQQMLDWMPEDIQRRFGFVEASIFNGNFLHIEGNDTESLLKAMADHGFSCENDEQLVESASGM